MPAQSRVRSENEESLFPILEAAGKKNDPAAIRLSEAWLLDVAVDAKRDRLLAVQGILCDGVGFTARKIGGGRKDDRIAGGLGEVQEGLFKERNQTGD